MRALRTLALAALCLVVLVAVLVDHVDAAHARSRLEELRTRARVAAKLSAQAQHKLGTRAKGPAGGNGATISSDCGGSQTGKGPCDVNLHSEIVIDLSGASGEAFFAFLAGSFLPVPHPATSSTSPFVSFIAAESSQAQRPEQAPPIIGPQVPGGGVVTGESGESGESGENSVSCAVFCFLSLAFRFFLCLFMASVREHTSFALHTHTHTHTHRRSPLTS